MPAIHSVMKPGDFKASFLSSERDAETILKKLFVQSKPYSDILKRLLIIDQPDCLDNSQAQYKTLIQGYDLRRLKEEEYITMTPRMDKLIHATPQVTILLEFDDFTPTSNLHYRDCTISFTIICPLDMWELDDYKLRPHQIAGYIDGILNNARLSGIGTLQFLGGSQLVLDEDYAGFMVRYTATHGNDDKDSFEDEWPLR